LVVEMIGSVSVLRLKPEFDDFLFAPIGEERNGMLLSVVSALARLNVDPWREAANLARLPKETGIQRLASLISLLPDRPSAHLDTRTIATRLITLLPRRPSSHNPSIPTGGTILGNRVAPNIPLGTMYVMSLMIFVLVAGVVMASNQLPARVSHAPAHAASTTSPKDPSRRSGQRRSTGHTLQEVP
jgi:hypothetical protein